MKRDAAKTLGKIGDVGAVAPLTPVLNAEEKENLVLIAAVEALIAIGVADAKTEQLARG